MSIAALIRRNKGQTNEAAKRSRLVRLEARSEISVITSSELKLIGTALYWAEGYKRPKRRGGREITTHDVSLANSDPALIKMFLAFLREVCDVPDEKIKISLRAFSHQNPAVLQKFWIQITGLPPGNFTKTLNIISRSSQGKRPYNQLPHGVIQIRVADTALFHKIMGWIEALQHFR